MWENIISRYYNLINTRRLFAITMVINHIIYFFFFNCVNDHCDYSIAVYRLIAILLCFPFLFKNFAFDCHSTSVNLYWYLAVTYCLPFFFTFMVLYYKLSTIWLMNTISALFLMILVLNFRIFICLLIIGVSAALFLGHTMHLLLAINKLYLLEILETYFAVIVIGVIFAFNKETIDFYKNENKNRP